MKKKLFKSEERGQADYGWLKARYSFSFANYYNPDNIHFGALRVLNDDIIEGGMGFGTHPHDNMEIISIPLKGAMKHRDSMSNEWIALKSGEVQVMSAGTGIRHSEMNNHPNEAVNLFQIWIIPDKNNVTPRYDQRSFLAEERNGKLQILVDSMESADTNALKIHQDARISRISLEKDMTFDYTLKSPDHGIFVMLIEGGVEVDGSVLEKRDAIGIEGVEGVGLTSTAKSDVLFIEVPMS